MPTDTVVLACIISAADGSFVGSRHGRSPRSIRRPRSRAASSILGLLATCRQGRRRMVFAKRRTRDSLDAVSVAAFRDLLVWARSRPRSLVPRETNRQPPEKLCGRPPTFGAIATSPDPDRADHGAVARLIMSSRAGPIDLSSHVMIVATSGALRRWSASPPTSRGFELDGWRADQFSDDMQPRDAERRCAACYRRAAAAVGPFHAPFRWASRWPTTWQPPMTT